MDENLIKPLPIYVPFVRGKIRNESHAKQLRDFSGLQFANNITPTDIDLFVEFNNRVFIIGEIKFLDHSWRGVDNEFLKKSGQRLALERLADTVGQSRDTALFIASHNTEAEKTINVASCPVEQYRFRGRWIVPDKQFTVREFIDWFLESYL